MRARGQTPPIGWSRGKRKKSVSSIAAVRALFDAVEASGRSQAWIAEQVNVGQTTLSYWRSGRHSPGLADFEAAAHALGYRVVLQPLSIVASDKD